MGKIFVITGPTCAGKDYIFSKILEDMKDKHTKSQIRNLERVIRFTNRKCRENEKDGVDYHFRTLKEMEDLIYSDFFIEYSSFKKFGEDGSYDTTIYGTSFDSIADPDKNYIMIGSLEVYRDLKEILPEGTVFPIMITANDRRRLRRYLDRNKDDSAYEICRRILDDQKKYNKEDLEALGINDNNTFYNNAENSDAYFDYLMESIYDYICYSIEER